MALLEIITRGFKFGWTLSWTKLKCNQRMFLTLDFKMEKAVLFGIPFWFVLKCFDTQQKFMLAKSDFPVTN